jgi:hypothetical protein
LSDASIFGDIEFQGEDIAYMPQKWDRIALTRARELLMISLVAPAQTVKGIRGILNTNSRCTISATGQKVKRESSSTANGEQPGRITRLGDTYRTETHKLPLGMAHAVFMTRSPGFLPSTAEEHVWQELMSHRYTTPLLRAWVPWIARTLKAQGLLLEAYCYNCNCGQLIATDQQLDQVVSDGLVSGSLLIESQRQAG